jgi:hypothetical protein
MRRDRDCRDDDDCHRRQQALVRIRIHAGTLATVAVVHRSPDSRRITHSVRPRRGRNGEVHRTGPEQTACRYASAHLRAAATLSSEGSAAASARHERRATRNRRRTSRSVSCVDMQRLAPVWQRPLPSTCISTIFVGVRKLNAGSTRHLRSRGSRLAGPCKHHDHLALPGDDSNHATAGSQEVRAPPLALRKRCTKRPTRNHTCRC